MKKDQNNFKILHLLSNNARLTSTDIAKEIKTTQQNANYLLSKLIDDKKVLLFKLLIDSSRFNLGNFCVFIRLKNYSKTSIESIYKELKKYKEIICIEYMFGSFDLFLKFATPNASNFNKILKEITTNNPTIILETMILTQIVLYNYPSNYMSRKRFQERTIISGDRETTTIDELDRQIINSLNKNSRTNYSKIAAQLNSTSKTIIQRVKNLERKNIIKGYSIVPNHKKLDINRHHLLLKVNFNDIEIEKQFNKFAQLQPNIVEFIKTFGVWDYIIITETLKIEDFKKLLYSIKEQFSNIITNYTFYESEEIKIWNYLPELEITNQTNQES